MTKTLADKVEKESFFLVEFVAPSETFRYTDAIFDIISSVGVFNLLESTMTLEIPPNTGAFDSKTCEIDLPFRSDTFIDHISAQRPYPITEVRIYEHFQDEKDSETYMHFWGRLIKATKNREGQEERVVIEAKGVKAFLKIPAGPIVADQCWSIFGKQGCFKSFVGLTENVVIDSIDGVKVTTRPLSRSFFDNRHFIRGVMTVAGLPITIVSWDFFTPREFILVKQPPVTWINQLALIEPGCDHSVEHCEFWANTQNFGGGGYAIPEYNPIIEQT